MTSKVTLIQKCGNPARATRFVAIVSFLAFVAGIVFGGCDGPPQPEGGVGDPGPQGTQGDRGPVGPAGEDGANCWDLDGDGEVSLEEEDFNGDGEVDVNDCRGPQGLPGQDGTDGQDGRDGVDGEAGPAGAQGPQGPQGERGERGPAGPPSPGGSNPDAGVEDPDASPPQEGVDEDGDGFETPLDCNDGDPGINPGTSEVCSNGVDEDCRRGPDDGCPTDPTDPCDPDGDGVPNIACDTDGDRVQNERDNCPTVANAGQANLDGDAQGDACDADTDGDEFTAAGGDCNDRNQAINPDATDICGNGVNEDCQGGDLACPVAPPPDADRDGVPDATDNCPAVSNAGQANLDGDALGDACDTDVDGDGFSGVPADCDDRNRGINSQAVEVCGNGVDEDCRNGDLACPQNPPAPADADGDGVLDGADNCPANANANQANLDGDALGDACDTDTDGDGVTVAQGDCNDRDRLVRPGVAEVCGNAVDEDCQGGAQACAPAADADGDGVPDATDNCPNAANAGQADLDVDRIGDACDTDTDGDGARDQVDCAPRDRTIFPGAVEVCGDGRDQDCVNGDCPVAQGCARTFRLNQGWAMSYSMGPNLDVGGWPIGPWTFLVGRDFCQRFNETLLFAVENRELGAGEQQWSPAAGAQNPSGDWCADVRANEAAAFDWSVGSGAVSPLASGCRVVCGPRGSPDWLCPAIVR